MSDQPIGIFDSGVGGTSIWKEIRSLLPDEHTIYLADSKHAPYGPKGKERIIQLCEKNTRLLLDMGCKLIVVACNTATTNAIGHLRAKFDVSFIGIEPAIKPAALNTKTKAVGILATKGTLSSALFNETSGKFASDVKVVEMIGEGIVPLIEGGKLDSPEMRELLKQYLQPMIEAKIDHLVLGCSHYPYLIPVLLQLLPSNVKIIDSGEAVARQTRNVLQKLNLLSQPRMRSKNTFYSNGNISVLKDLIGSDYEVEYRDF